MRTGDLSDCLERQATLVELLAAHEDTVIDL